MRIYWPGPVTVVVPGRDGGTVGLRCPAHRLTRNILERVGATVVATSANVSGEAPALTAEEVLERFPEGLAAVVDGGKSDLGIASCVVEFQSDGSWSVVREGIVDAEAIRRRLRTVILFVCTGNTCRSPLAVALTRKLLAEARGVTPDELEGLGTTVFSGGLFASEGSPGAPHAVEAAKALGADMSRHRTHRVTAADLGDADRIIAMTISHARTLASLAPECTERIELLDPEHGDFEDPFGGTLDEYLACARRMEAALRIKLGLGESA
jgi:protein-tyrosine phosphatase